MAYLLLIHLEKAYNRGTKKPCGKYQRSIGMLVVNRVAHVSGWLGSLKIIPYICSIATWMELSERCIIGRKGEE